MNATTHYLPHALAPAAPGWTAHLYYRHHCGGTDVEVLPLAGWMTLVADDSDEPADQHHRRILPAWWADGDATLETTDDIEETSNTIVRITGPGQDSPDHDTALADLDRKIAQQEAETRRNAEIADLILGALTEAGATGLSTSKLWHLVEPWVEHHKIREILDQLRASQRITRTATGHRIAEAS